MMIIIHLFLYVILAFFGTYFFLVALGFVCNGDINHHPIVRKVGLFIIRLTLAFALLASYKFLVGVLK